ncbi:gamma-aminobutyric acid receptor alpha-like isoform X1 [Daphnia pulex]|uniref:gamma-aminobutyric acid receptor alpha-like isoform X1 n=2 Tax=Daphnia pulex TaxID=6669 RepID=UPI001EDCCC26|nr:gamma-aminobutyric acid receptor alpha-like isoform X1 [Daphnia pulex]XP_046438615.1 gamma-aminobutyric acid receptor alpha-like isoform X1 [Daphnia pulex]XP_046438616.1 gamma-aminobutyric acid receptor alpha-like isoform X1 [Daphnia pulex]
MQGLISITLFVSLLLNGLTLSRQALVISPSRIRNNKDNREMQRSGATPMPSPQHNRTNDAIRALSRNITSLLENLLKNYDSNHHPGYDSGLPTIVKSNILVRSMGPFSEHRMDYSMDCYFRQSWQDRRLSFNGPIETLSLSIKMLEGIWKPDTFIYNGKKSYLHTITTPNKLLRINKDGSILYSVRLTIKAKCSMDLREFPMDHQSCPLILGSYSYDEEDLLYVWDEDQGVKFLGDVELSQFDLISSPYRNASISRKRGLYSVLQVSFNLRRKQGYFLIQVYVPCILIVVLSWVSFWLNREATSDRINLGITTVLTLSTLAMDTRTDLPKVHYATALDWFILITFGYCMASIIQFASVHYFTKIGSGENYQTQEISVLHRKLMEIKGSPSNEPVDGRIIRTDFADWEKLGAELPQMFTTPPVPPCTPSGIEEENVTAIMHEEMKLNIEISDDEDEDDGVATNSAVKIRTNRRHTDRSSRLQQLYYCLVANQSFRAKRKRRALAKGNIINSVSKIDSVSRILFPVTFSIINVIYWWGFIAQNNDFTWNKMDNSKFY